MGRLNDPGLSPQRGSSSETTTPLHRQGLISRALFQISILATAVTAWRAIGSPSTMAFFLFESSLAVSLGSYGYTRLELRQAEIREAAGDILSRSRSFQVLKIAEAEEPSLIGPTGTLQASEAHRRRIGRVMGILLFLSLAVGISLLSTSLYVAAPAFYVVIGFACGVLAVNIHYNGERHPAALLIQVFLLGALVKLYFFYLNPYVYASDSLLQYGGVRDIANTGFVTLVLGHYYYFPGFALFAYVGATTTGVALNLFGIFPLTTQLVLIPATYLVGRISISARAGLFASLLMMFSVFAFLSTHYTPALYGLPFVLLAIYAVLQYETRREPPWLACFWFAALAAFFSHPVNALILALILVIRFAHLRIVEAKIPGARRTDVPALSYGVAYAAYVAFIAAFAFEVFVQTIFVTTYAPALATAPIAALQKTPLYVLQSAIAPASLGIITFLAVVGLLTVSGMPRREHQFCVLLGLVFVLVPLFEIITENYRTQSSRFLLYLTIPLVLLAAHGVTSATRGTSNPRKIAVLLLALFATFGFLASSTYLTSNDSTLLSTDIPTTTTHITASAIASRDFLAKADPGSSIYMDFGSWVFFDNGPGSPNALSGHHTSLLEYFPSHRGPSFVLINEHFLSYGNPVQGVLYSSPQVRALVGDDRASLLYDAGEVQVFLAP